MGRSAVVATFAVALLLAACGSTGEDAVPAPSVTPPTSVSPTPTGPAPGPTAGLDLPADLRQRPPVATAIADAARREDVRPEQVHVATWAQVTWNDGSMGCPSPGATYTQATVDGQLLLLRVDMTLLAYHAGPEGTFTYCADPQGTYIVRS